MFLQPSFTMNKIKNIKFCKNKWYPHIKFLSTCTDDQNDDYILEQLHNNNISHHKLESITNDPFRAVKLRREYT